jgi:hypothetical protein
MPVFDPLPAEGGRGMGSDAIARVYIGTVG